MASKFLFSLLVSGALAGASMVAAQDTTPEPVEGTGDTQTNTLDLGGLTQEEQLAIALAGLTLVGIAAVAGSGGGGGGGGETSSTFD